MSMTGWTESQESIEARRRRILQGTTRARRVQALLDSLFPGFTQAQRTSRLRNAATAYLRADHSTPDSTLTALQELIAVLAKVQGWKP